MSQSQHPTRRIPLAVPIIRQRAGVRGPALSVLLHVLTIAVLAWGAQKGADALAGPGEGPGRGGGGGGGSRVFRVLLPFSPPPAAPQAVVTLPQQLELPAEEQKLDSIVPPSPDTSGNAQYDRAGQGAGTGPGTGPGAGTGTGGGTGPGTGSGVGPDSGGGGGRVYPPQLQGMLIPPMENRPSNLRGVQVTVRFDVSERGQVLSVETDPEIRDRGYRNLFMDRMRRYTFSPALLDGRPVRGRAEVRIRL